MAGDGWFCVCRLPEDKHSGSRQKYPPEGKQNNYITLPVREREHWSLFLLTELEDGDITPDPRTHPSAGCYLHAVADPWGQAGNQNG